MERLRWLSAGVCGLDMVLGTSHMKKFLYLIVVVVAVYAGLTQYRELPMGDGQTTGAESVHEDALERAWRSRASGVQLQGQGAVIKVLRDDNVGSRHQKFILKLRSGRTLLVAHNIDIAPRVGSVRKGDQITFYGEYEWNSKGGVIHWTHHDPNGRHVGGWLKHNGKTYQ